MRAISEFVRNTSDTWVPTVQTEVATNITSTMASDQSDDASAGSVTGNVGIVVPIVIAVLAVLAVVVIFIYCYCCRRRRQLQKQALAEHAQYRHTIKDHPSSVFSVEKNLTAIEASNVTTERRLRYSGEPAVSSLPNSGRSVSYDCLGDGDKVQPWPSLRDSVASDNGYYGSETLHISTSQLSRSVGQAQGFLQDDNAPERSLSSDHIQKGGWPGVSRRPGSKASSLGRDSGLGGSQETCLSYQTDLKSSLSNFSMSSTEAEDELDCGYERPKSLPPFHGHLPFPEIKKIEDIPIRSMFPGKPCLDENDNQPDVYKHIQFLRDKFYTMRDQSGARDEAGHQVMGTPNFVISIFGSEGGHLQLLDGSATLAVPKDALPFGHEVYLYAYYENACIDGKSYLRRVIECGPDGLAFKKPVCLSFIPRLIPCDDSESETDLQLKVVFKNNEPEKWRPMSKKESFFHAEAEFVSIHVNHFTRFTVEPAGGSVQLVSGGSSSQLTSQTSQDGETRKFYVSVYVGPTAGGATQYRVCFIERDKDKLKKHNNNMAHELFRQAVASPKLFSVTSQGHDVRIEIPSLHGCEFKSPSKKHVIPIDEFDEQTVEDIGPPQRDFLLGLTKHNTEGLFEVAVFQENIHDKVLTLCICMNLNHLKEKVSSDFTELTHRDVMEFLAGTRLAAYRHPSVYFPKRMKMDICTMVEGSQPSAWTRLAETARIPGNKSSWLESYVRGKYETPCYVVLDFIEAQLIAKDVGICEACDQLIRMLERSGFETATDYCNAWKSELLKQSTQRSPQKDKAGRFPYGRMYPNLSPSREELGTILEENNSNRDGSAGIGPSSQTRVKTKFSFDQDTAPNGLRSTDNRQYLVDNLSNLNISPPLHFDYSGEGRGSGQVMSLQSPNQTPYTISRPYDSTPVANRRPNKVLLKANREKSGRNDSGIGSDIASPVDNEGERTSHI